MYFIWQFLSVENVQLWGFTIIYICKFTTSDSYRIKITDSYTVSKLAIVSRALDSWLRSHFCVVVGLY